MESANFHHHQQQDHQFVDSSSFSWSQNPILNNGTNNNITSRNLVTNTNSIVQDLFPYNGMGYPIESYPKFLELLNYNSTSNMEELELHDLELQSYSSYLKNNVDHQQNSYTNDHNQDFLFTNYINGCQIFPNISVSSLKQSTTTSTSSSSTSSSSVSPSSFDMNCLPALDPFGYSFDRRMHQPNHTPSVCPSKISSTGSTYQSSKRPASKYVDAKETKSVAPKKSKSEPRSSSAPFQVRKEKLGDRIAAIQQLVAPFGKTDTASVLMEAIGYIKFLQTQVETLSMPYMKSANEIGGMSLQRERMKDGNKGVNRDLRSRGLCLVPVSCLSYVTDGNEGFWSAS